MVKINLKKKKKKQLFCQVLGLTVASLSWFKVNVIFIKTLINNLKSLCVKLLIYRGLRVVGFFYMYIKCVLLLNFNGNL